MDLAKCRKLISDFQLQPEPWIVPIERFFDGNDDPGSIGWKVDPYPGMEAFRDVLTGLLKRPDVEAAYVRLDDLGFGEDTWPSADVLFVVGSISPEELQNVLSPLTPPKSVATNSWFPRLLRDSTGPRWWPQDGPDDDSPPFVPLVSFC
jgi:hypothetical protein